MNVSRELCYCCFVLGLGLSTTLGGCAQRTMQSRAVASDQANPAGASAGKALFVARCASCHDERGDKPLRVGLPLNQRKLSREVVAKAVQGRLKDRTEAERQAVVEYIAGLYVGARE